MKNDNAWFKFLNVIPVKAIFLLLAVTNHILREMYFEGPPYNSQLTFLVSARQGDKVVTWPEFFKN